MIEFEDAKIGHPVKNSFKPSDNNNLHKRNRRKRTTSFNLSEIDLTDSNIGNNNNNNSLDNFENAIDTEEVKCGLNLWRLVALTFFTVSGGPYGVEPLVAQCGPLYALVGLAIVPWIWGLPSALMTAELGAAIPEMGGYIVWVQRSLGDFWAFQNAWYNIFSNILDNALYPVMFCDYLQAVIGYEFSYMARTSIAVSLVLVLGCVNIIGVDIVGDGAGVFGIFVILPFIILVFMGFFGGQMEPADWLITLPEKNWGFYFAMLLWNTCGYDSAGTCAAEVDDPGKTFPKAMLITIIGTTLLYMLPLMVGITYVTNYEDYDDGFFVTIGLFVGGSWLKFFIMIAANISSLGQLNSVICTSSRALACMGGFGYVPTRLAKIHPKYGTPISAIFFNCFAIISMVATGLNFEEIAQMSMWLYAITLIFEFIALIKLRYSEPELERPYKIPGGLLGVYLLSIPPCICCIILMILSTKLTWILSACVILFTLLITPVFYYTSGKPAILPKPLLLLLRCMRCYTFQQVNFDASTNSARVIDSNCSGTFDDKASKNTDTSCSTIDSDGVELSSRKESNIWTDNTDAIFDLRRTDFTENVSFEEITGTATALNDESSIKVHEK